MTLSKPNFYNKYIPHNIHICMRRINETNIDDIRHLIDGGL